MAYQDKLTQEMLRRDPNGYSALYREVVNKAPYRNWNDFGGPVMWQSLGERLECEKTMRENKR
jgi:hypothetical protein